MRRSFPRQGPNTAWSQNRIQIGQDGSSIDDLLIARRDGNKGRSAVAAARKLQLVNWQTGTKY